MDKNTYLHLTLKPKILNARVNNKGLRSIEVLKFYLHMKYEKVNINSISTMDIKPNLNSIFLQANLKVKVKQQMLQ